MSRRLKRPSADILAKLASAFGMLPSQVLEYIESRTPPPRVGIAYHTSPALRRESVHVLEHVDLPMMVASPAPVRSTLQTLVSFVQELNEDDLKVLLEPARHLRAKRK